MAKRSVSGQTRIETKLRRFAMKVMGYQGKLRVWTVGLFASNRNKPMETKFALVKVWRNSSDKAYQLKWEF